MKPVAVFEFMNPMPRLPFERKSGHGEPPWSVLLLQLALAAFIQKSVGRTSATGTPTLWKHGAFLQAFRAHLLFLRKHLTATART
jgi:hypothetical protein